MKKTTAERKLKELLSKHGIVEADLFKSDKRKFKFKVPRKDEWLFWRIVWNVILDWDTTYWRNRSKKTEITLEIDNAQFIEIEAKFDFYKKDFETQLDVFKSAFTHKNKLYANESDERKRQSDAQPDTPVDKKRLFQISMIMEGIDKAQFKKQIGYNHE